MKIKCPTCKSVIKFAHGEESDIVCKQCETRYNRKKIEAAVARLANQDRRPVASSKSQSDSNPQRITASDVVITTKGKASAAQVAVVEQPIQVENGHNSINTLTANTAKKQNRRKSRRAYLMAGMVALCLALASVLYVVYKNNNSPPITSNDAALKSNEVAADLETKYPDGKPKLDLPEVKKTTQPDLSKIPFALVDKDSQNKFFQFPKVSNRFKSQKTLSDSWFVVKPYMVELHAQTPLGPSFASGIIIDSRGWVLTSYRAMSGATDIHVRSARQSISDESEPLTDKVRGYVAIDPARDLVILSINRRLIDAFEDLPLATEDALVESEYVVQCQSPTAVFPQTTIESRILQRFTLNDLSERDSNRLKRQDVSPDVQWIRHQQNSPLRYGSALVDDAGNLTAMNTGFRFEDSEDLLAIPSVEIIKFKTSAHDTVLELPIAGSEFDNSGINLVEQLNRLGSECEIFGWIAEGEDDDSVFRDFLVAFIELRKTIVAGEDSETFESIKNRLDEWQAKMEEALGVKANLSYDFQVSFNEKFAKIDRGAGQPFAGFAYVEYAATESPLIGIDDPDNPFDSVVFEFKGTGDVIITNLDPEWRPMPPDSPWLLIGEPKGGKVRLRNRDNERQELQMSKVIVPMQSD